MLDIKIGHASKFVDRSLHSIADNKLVFISVNLIILDIILFVSCYLIAYFHRFKLLRGLSYVSDSLKINVLCRGGLRILLNLSRNTRYSNH